MPSTNLAAEKDVCSICLGEVENRGIIACEHTFCMPCIHDWSKVTNLCPICKKSFSKITPVESAVVAVLGKRKASSQKEIKVSNTCMGQSHQDSIFCWASRLQRHRLERYFIRNFLSKTCYSRWVGGFEFPWCELRNWNCRECFLLTLLYCSDGFKGPSFCELDDSSEGFTSWLIFLRNKLMLNLGLL